AAIEKEIIFIRYIMHILPVKVALLGAVLFATASMEAVGQEVLFEFGEITSLEKFTSGTPDEGGLIKWFNVNTEADTWVHEDSVLVCKGLPIGVIRSEKQYENFIMHVEWKHIEAGGNSGTFVWSAAVPGENRLPDGVEVQMLDLEWVDLNLRDGVKPPIAYVHGELFGVGGVETVPDNPRGTRSKSIENLVKGKGEWNTYDVVCVDGVIKL